MCDVFDTGRCPFKIIVTSNIACFRLLQEHLTDNFIFFETTSFSDFEKGILLFSKKDRDKCSEILNTVFCKAKRCSNCFHEYTLTDTFVSSQTTVRECDSTS